MAKRRTRVSPPLRRRRNPVSSPATAGSDQDIPVRFVVQPHTSGWVDVSDQPAVQAAVNGRAQARLLQARAEWIPSITNSGTDQGSVGLLMVSSKDFVGDVGITTLVRAGMKLKPITGKTVSTCNSYPDFEIVASFSGSLYVYFSKVHTESKGLISVDVVLRVRGVGAF
jgi:hypothetical protein